MLDTVLFGIAIAFLMFTLSFAILTMETVKRKEEIRKIVEEEIKKETIKAIAKEIIKQINEQAENLTIIEKETEN